jgi:Inner membrane protein YgaP-like, transmembrane domain
MNANVGSTDKIVRLVLALAAVVFALVTGLGTALGIVLVVVGVVLAATAFTGFCPIYRVLGMSTCPVRR